MAWIAVLAVASSFGVARIAATTTELVTFDDLKTTSAGGGGQVPVTDQYAGLGIRFDPVLAFDYSAEPGFTRSGNVAIEQCYGVEFCPSPIAADFSDPVSRVRLWVGYHEPLGNDLELVLVATDASGKEISADKAILPANKVPTPISIPLEVSDPAGQIARVVLQPADPTNVMNNVAVDDVEFDQGAVALEPELAIGGVDWSVTDDTLLLTALVLNNGQAASGSSAVLASALGWIDARTDLPPIDPGTSTRVTLSMTIPTEARGQTSNLTVTVDPDGTSGDSTPDDNATDLAVVVPLSPPGFSASTGPTPSAPSEAPATALPLPNPPGDGVGSIAIAGAILGLAVVGGGLVGRMTWNRWTGSLTVGRKASLELAFEDEEPTGPCTPGNWRCRRQAAFNPHRRHIAELSAVARRDGSPRKMSWNAEALSDLTSSVREARGQAEGSPERRQLRANALALASDVVDWIGAEEPVALEITARVAGPDATATFTAYRCGRADDGGAFRRIGDWTKTISDTFVHDVVANRRFEARQGAAAALAVAIEAGLVDLGERMGRYR